MIKPTIGRIVHYYSGVDDNDPQAAIVVHVHNDRMINITAFTHGGGSIPHTSVPLVQPEDDLADRYPGGHCVWMPYQIKKTTGSESGEKESGTDTI